MIDNSPTVFCAYCGEEIKNHHGTSFYGFVGYHDTCPYEWDVDKWCKVCGKPICICDKGDEQSR